MATKTNAEIAAAFDELGDLYELDGAVSYRVIAYRTAAKAVRDASVSIMQLTREGKVTTVPGIGKTLEEKLRALDETGDIPSAVKLRAKFPSGLISIMHLPGFGAKRAKLLYDELGIDSLEKLREAAEAEQIDHGAVMLLHRRFHRVLYRCCGNRYVIESLDGIWDRIDASRVLVTLYPALRLSEAVGEHDALLDRLERGEDDPGVLESCAREHNLNAIRTIRKNVVT